MFDESKGYTFTTYAVSRLRFKLLSYINVSTTQLTIRHRTVSEYNIVKATARKYHEEFNTHPTAKDIADMIRNNEDISTNISQNKVISLLAAFENSVSLDAKVNNTDIDNAEIKDVIGANCKELEHFISNKYADDIVSNLTDDDAKLLNYMLNDELNQSDIASLLNTTQPSVSRKINKLKKKLK